MELLQQRRHSNFSNTIRIIFRRRYRISTTNNRNLSRFLLLTITGTSFRTQPTFLRANSRAQRMRQHSNFRTTSVSLPNSRIIIHRHILLRFINSPRRFRHLTMRTQTTQHRQGTLNIITSGRLRTRTFFRIFSNYKRQQLNSMRLTQDLHRTTTLNNNSRVTRLSRIVDNRTSLLGGAPRAPTLRTPILRCLRRRTLLPRRTTLTN